VKVEIEEGCLRPGNRAVFWPGRTRPVDAQRLLVISRDGIMAHDGQPGGGLFACVDEEICKVLGLAERKQLEHRRTYKKIKSVQATMIVDLVRRLYERVSNNLGEREPSKMNWILRRRTSVRETNLSIEVVLERAVVLLAEHKHLAGWYNQMPVASGLIDGRSHKRAAVDLARIAKDRLDLYELKWKSNTPLYAAFEILRYGLAYLLCRASKAKFKYDHHCTMKVNALGLNVLAPDEFYEGGNLLWLQEGLDTGIRRVAQEQLGCEFQASFRFLALKREPTDPEKPMPPFFKTGAAAKVACGAEPLGTEAMALVQAMGKLSPAWSGPASV
jgi:hypothetical protein